MEAFSISSRQEFVYSITEIEERIRDIDEEYGRIRSFDDVNKHEMELSILNLDSGSSIFLDYGEWYILNAKTIEKKYQCNELPYLLHQQRCMNYFNFSLQINKYTHDNNY